MTTAEMTTVTMTTAAMTTVAMTTAELTTAAMTTVGMTTAAVVDGIYESSFLTLKYTDQVDSTNFVITSKTGTTSNVYFAFGLSNDFDKMVN